MNKTQGQLVIMINSAIHEEKVKIDNTEIINWDDLLEEASFL